MPKRQHARLADDVVLGHLREHGPTTAMILSRRLACYPDTIRAHLRELLADGRIVRHGRGTKGSPFRYEVAS